VTPQGSSSFYSRRRRLAGATLKHGTNSSRAEALLTWQQQQQRQWQQRQQNRSRLLSRARSRTRSKVAFSTLGRDPKGLAKQYLKRSNGGFTDSEGSSSSSSSSSDTSSRSSIRKSSATSHSSDASSRDAFTIREPGNVNLVPDKWPHNSLTAVMLPPNLAYDHATKKPVKFLCGCQVIKPPLPTSFAPRIS
jgi:hypothetical protein